ncbi:uncharacterized protein PG986_012602 [Apiospora aurea]|uniref:Uncharacterized protein n=1 Tax=Apiospora aurea TaxID=335848 RepID=A0ABR1Q0F4_9PEZI
MYLNDTEIVEPPAAGWSHIDHLRCMGKTDEVYELLRRLPYLRVSRTGETPEAAARCHFANWAQIAQYASSTSSSGYDGDGHRICSEPPELIDTTPPCVIGLTYGGRDNPLLLAGHRAGHRALDIPEDEADWRRAHPAWSVPDFFDLLPGQFQNLNFVPIGSREVFEIHARGPGNPPALLAAVQDIYRRHGWPELANFRKRECLRAVRRTLREEFPFFFREVSWEEDGEGDEE